MLAPFEGAEVEKTEIDRFFDLVDFLVGQVNAGSMGFVKFDMTGRGGVDVRIEQALMEFFRGHGGLLGSVSQSRSSLTWHHFL
jgi:hypothetical protein